MRPIREELAAALVVARSEPERALRTIEALLVDERMKLAPDLLVNARCAAGVLAAQLGDNAAAIAHYVEVRSSRPEDPMVLLALGTHLQAGGRSAEALTVLKLARHFARVQGEEADLVAAIDRRLVEASED